MRHTLVRIVDVSLKMKGVIDVSAVLGTVACVSKETKYAHSNNFESKERKCCAPGNGEEI